LGLWRGGGSALRYLVSRGDAGARVLARSACLRIYIDEKLCRDAKLLIRHAKPAYYA